MPGTNGNVNAATHGLLTPNLPKGLSYVRRQLTIFKRSLEAAVLATHGELSLYHRCVIQTATFALGHASKASHWSRKAGDKLTAMEHLHFSREACKALAERDRCIRALGLDGSGEPPYTFDLPADADDDPPADPDPDPDPDPQPTQ